MARGHTPFGYRIQNGRAVICESEVQQVKGIYSGYLSGLCYVESARRVGLKMNHGSVKRLMRNRHYLGDDFYPAIIDREIFEAAEKERQRRSTVLGRDNKVKPPSVHVDIPVCFALKHAKRKFLDPFRQAEYIYSLIEKRFKHGNNYDDPRQETYWQQGGSGRSTKDQSGSLLPCVY